MRGLVQLLYLARREEESASALRDDMVDQFMRSEQRRNTFGMAERTVLTTTTSVEEVPRKIRFLRFWESAKAAKSSFLLFWSGTLHHQMIFLEPADFVHF